MWGLDEQKDIEITDELITIIYQDDFAEACQIAGITDASLFNNGRPSVICFDLDGSGVQGRFWMEERELGDLVKEAMKEKVFQCTKMDLKIEGDVLEKVEGLKYEEEDDYLNFYDEEEIPKVFGRIGTPDSYIVEVLENGRCIMDYDVNGYSGSFYFTMDELSWMLDDLLDLYISF